MNDKTPWVRTIRRASGLVEHVCQHGVGHPAIGSVLWLDRAGPEGAKGSWGTHGCDGCCRAPAWRLADALEGLRIATELLFEAKKRINRENFNGDNRNSSGAWLDEGLGSRAPSLQGPKLHRSAGNRVPSRSQ